MIDTIWTRRPAFDVVPLFAMALFVSSSLMFLAEPMIAKMLLPILGGAPMVWTTCVAFFQIMLLAGYAYSWIAARWLPWRLQVLTYAAVLALSLAALPFTLRVGLVPPPATAPVASVLLLLVTAIGAPFFMLSTTASVLQHWFARTGHAAARDPYFLYIASNVGSLIALLAYPGIVEPTLPLDAQRRWWFVGYASFVCLTLLCGVIVWRRSTSGSVVVEPPPIAFNRPTVARRAAWVTLAFIPASLMLAVTAYLSTDIAAMPLLWVGPLALYLLTFILAFGSQTQFWLALSDRALPLLVLPVAIFMITGTSASLWIAITMHLLTFAAVALRFHGALASVRPPPALLTEFYFWIACGGMLGGLFNALVAPVLFTGIAEYPIVLVLACLIRAREPATAATSTLSLRGLRMPVAVAVTTAGLLWAVRHVTDDPRMLAAALGLPALMCFSASRERTQFAAGMGAMLVAGSLGGTAYGRVLHVERTFFGVHRVSVDASGTYHSLFHGTTLHGMQALAESRRNEPLTYYHRTGPLGQLFERLPRLSNAAEIAVVGLGVGAVASYAKPNQRWTFYEIDPAVERIARDPRYFTFLGQCGSRCRVTPGDARLSLARERPNSFGMIVVDAFSSDAIPTHLITSEAMSLYLTMLAPDGVLAFHVSNRHLSLGPVLARLAFEHRLAMREQLQPVTPEEEQSGKRVSDWVVLARDEAGLGSVAGDERWATVDVSPSLRLWTDDFSNVVGVLRMR